MESPLKRKLLYRATHRGIREMDIILGDYAHQYIEEMGDHEIRIFSLLLNISDQPLFSAFSEKSLPTACSAFSNAHTEIPTFNHIEELEALFVIIWHWMRKHPHAQNITSKG